MDHERLTKDNVWYHLLNFSKNRWLSSDYFFQNLVAPIDKSSPEGRKELEKAQRELAKVIAELICDLRTLKDTKRIVSSGEGYKIANSPEEVLIGKKYLYSKIDEVLQRIKWLEDGYNEMVHPRADKQTQDLFV